MKKLITKTDKAVEYLELIKDSLSETEVDKMFKMSRWERIEYIIQRFETLKLAEIRQLQMRLRNESRKYEKSVIKEQIIELMDELHGKREPTRARAISITTDDRLTTRSNNRDVHFR